MRGITRRRTLLGLSGVALAAAGSRLAQAARPSVPPPVQPSVPPYRPPPLPRAALDRKPPGAAWFVPAPPRYPTNLPRERLLADARGWSGALDAYVRAWLDGRASADLPDAFVVPGVWRRDFPRFRLLREEEIDVERQWARRLAHPIDPAALQGSFPDPNVTYLIAPLYAPFGATLVMEGEFPHARFFDAQITPAFDPDSYHYDGGVGVGEVPIVDADVEPLPGHENPYRVGARRDAVRRGYRLEFPLTIGDPVALDPAFRPPYFRAPGNRRHGSAIVWQGPWGATPGIGGHGRGAWDVGYLWVRYYRPDDAAGPYAGVPLPRLHYVLDDGRRFWLEVDSSGLHARANRTVTTRPGVAEPSAREHNDAGFGWAKQVGIFRAVIGGLAMGTGWGTPAYVRALDRGVAGRGHDLPAPNHYEQSKTSATYVDYLVRGMNLGRDRVVVLTGRMPTFPRTRGGEPTMLAAEARYWSIVGYALPEGWDWLRALSPDAVNGVAQHAVMDEEVTLDADRRYVIAFGRAAERPANATADAGVTWVDWGNAPRVSWTLRWLTVGPEWTAPHAPTPGKVGPHGDWAHPEFDPAVMWRRNDHRGVLGEYQPRVHYLTRTEFERLGSPVRAGDVPSWTAGR